MSRPVKYIVGVDPSLRATAVSIFDNTGKHIESFTIKTPQGATDHASVDQIAKEFFERLAPYTTPVVVRTGAIAFFIEDVTAHARNGKSAGRAEAIGVIKWNLRQEGYLVYGVAASSLLSFLTKGVQLEKKRIARAEKKALTMRILHVKYNFYTTDDNQADSYSAGLFGYAYLILKQRLTVRAMCRIV